MQVHDGCTDQIAPLGPGTVVIADVLVTEQIFQNEPSVGTSFADAAVRDSFISATNALGFVKLFEFVVGLEGTVVIGGLGPGNVDRSGNVSSAESGFGQARRPSGEPMSEGEWPSLGGSNRAPGASG